MASMTPIVEERPARVVVVASKAAIKCNAVRNALDDLPKSKLLDPFRDTVVYGVSAASGVAEQPYGFDETLLGASNRLEAAKLAFPPPNTNMNAEVVAYVSIENGLVQLSGSWYDFAWVLVENKESGRASRALSAMVRFPSRECNLALDAGAFASTTVGSVISERIRATTWPADAAPLPADSQDPHSALTENCVSRTDLLADTVLICLGQLSSPITEGDA